MTKFTELRMKMCVIGDAEVGKTSLIRKFVIDKFDDKYITTIGTKTSKKTLTIKDDNANVNLKLMIWDILGQKGSDEIRKGAYKGADGAFIVLDLTRRNTLYSFEGWLLSLYGVAKEIPVVVLANKSDLDADFGKDEIEKLVTNYSFPYYLTSAKTGDNVNEAFHTLGNMMIKPWKGQHIEVQLEIAKLLGEDIRTGMGKNKRLTALEVEDIIVASYCNLLKDQNFAMAIIRKQFKKAGANFNNPTPQELLKIVNYLIEVASGQVDSATLKREKKVYANLIKRIE